MDSSSPEPPGGPPGPWRAELAAAWRGLTAGRRGGLLAIACAALVAFGSQFAEMPWRSALRGADSSYYYFWLRSLMVDGDWDFRNDLQECNTMPPELKAAMLQEAPTPAGRQPNKFGVGWALLSVPPYLLADGVVAAGRGLGVWSLARDGYNPVYQSCLYTWHFLLALAGLLLAWRVVRRWCGDPGAALVGVVLLWAASPLAYYGTIKVSMSHNAAFLAVALMCWGLQAVPDRPDRGWPWWVAGTGLGLAVIVRFQLAVFAVVPAWIWLRGVRAAGGRAAFRNAIAALLGALPLIFLQLFAWHVVYGRWFLFTYGVGGEGFNWSDPQWLNVLFGARHGLFYWHPLLLLGAAGFAGLVWRDRPRGLAAAGLVAVLASAYVNAAWWCWWFGGSFGSRAFEAACLFFMGGLAWLWRTFPAARPALWAAGLASAAWNFYLLALFHTAAVPLDSAVTWADMARAGGRMLHLVADFFRGGGGGA